MKTVYMQGTEWIGETGQWALAGTYIDLPKDKAIELIERNAALPSIFHDDTGDVTLNPPMITKAIETKKVGAANAIDSKPRSSNGSNRGRRKPNKRKRLSKD